MVEKFKFGIIGVGPTGGILAAHLVKAGHNVVIVDMLIFFAHFNVDNKLGIRCQKRGAVSCGLSKKAFNMGKYPLLQGLPHFLE